MGGASDTEPRWRRQAPPPAPILAGRADPIRRLREPQCLTEHTIPHQKPLMPTHHLLHLLAAATIGAISSFPAPAHAGVSAAAWTTANTFCTGLRAGLPLLEAMRIAMSDNRGLWGNEMQDPAFQKLMLAQSVEQCRDLMINAPR